MTPLVLQLPARARHSRGAPGAPASARPLRADHAARELAFVLTPDGLAISQQGRAAPALLPAADSVVVVLSDSDVSWHRLALPRAPAARLRAAIASLLEEKILDEPEAMHFALAPGASAGQTAWVAAIDKAWFAAELAGLEKAGLQVERAVPISWPEDTPLGHFSAAFGDDASAPMQLTWSASNGVRANTAATSLR